MKELIYSFFCGAAFGSFITIIVVYGSMIYFIKKAADKPKFGN